MIQVMVGILAKCVGLAVSTTHSSLRMQCNIGRIVSSVLNLGHMWIKDLGRTKCGRRDRLARMFLIEGVYGA